MVVLHDLPGSARADETFIKALGRGRPAFGLDLSGFCDSDPLAEQTPDAYANQIIATLDKLGLDVVDMVAVGLSTPLALHLAANHGNRVRKLALDGIMMADAELRTEMKVNYVPDLRPLLDGSHLHRYWHMLRDQAVHWPWYDGSVDAVRMITPDMEPHVLNMRLIDTLKQWDHASDAIAAALDIDGQALVKRWSTK